MKKLVFIFFTSIFSLSAQTNTLNGVDKIIYSYSNINSIEELTRRIDYDFKTDTEKTRAAFTWIALNISYENKNPNLIEANKVYWVFSDDDLKRKIKKENDKVARNTFRNKTAVCKGYAFLFHEICTQLKIKNKLVKGYVKINAEEIGHVPVNKNHVWNAVQINNEWLFLDATWASGSTENGVWKQKLDTSYFNVSKKTLRLTHYPSEQYWIEYLGQKPLKDFCFQPIQTTVFTNSNAILVLPNQGIIKTIKNRNINLKIQNLKPNTQVLYKYGNSKKVKSARQSSNKLITSINLKGTNRNNYLHIYFNNSLALSYKVEVE
jgi:hypothetical protein